MGNEARESDAYFCEIRQGHVLNLDGGQFVVISQTCDVVLPKRPTIIIARIVSLAGGELKLAQGGAMPRYVPLPMLKSDSFADLCYVETRDKEEVAWAAYTPGVQIDSHRETREFSLAVTRWFGRFAFPDEIVPWLRPLERLIKKKYEKVAERDELGQLLSEIIVELRVEADWAQQPYKIELHTIVRSSARLTLSDDEIPIVTDDFLQEVREAEEGQDATVSIAKLFLETQDPAEREHALNALAQAFAKICVPPADAGDSVSRAVASIEGQLWADDDFPLTRVRKSEPLDLEFLSTAAVADNTPDKREADPSIARGSSPYGLAQRGPGTWARLREMLHRFNRSAP